MKFLGAILLVIALQSPVAAFPNTDATADPDTLGQDSSAAFFSRPFVIRDERSSFHDVEHIRSFAEMLFREGQYGNAAVEYQRFLLGLPDSERSAKEYAWLRAAESYRLAGRYDLALRQLDSLMVWNGVTDSTRCRANIGKARCFHDQGMHAASLRILEDDGAFCGSAGRGYRAVDRSILLTAQHIHIRQWDTAVSSVDQGLASADATQHGSLQTLRSLAERGRALRGPKPLLAGAFSAVVPGAGKVYAGRTVEGIYAFVLNGLAIWQSIDGFHDDGTSSVKGWTTGAIGLVLYLGNVYGSVRTAIAVRDGRVEEFFDDVDRVVDRGMSR